MTQADPVAGVARALLYEGFALYPYRPSALKNRQRWFFGGVWPPAWTAAHADDPDQLGAQLLLQGDAAAISAEMRFLQFDADGGAQERCVQLPWGALRRHCEFEFGPLRGAIELATSDLGPVTRLGLRIRNASVVEARDRDATLPATLASVHAVLRLRGGAWISLLEPPPQFAAQATACVQQGLYPVLAGAPGSRDAALVAPITLYDYPRVAAESAGDLFDATEIDEILTLRVQTLSDAERAELAAADPRVRALLERADAMTPAGMGRLHGALRDARPATAGALAPGARVRLRPRAGGDVFDLALDGRVATVTAVEQDFDGGVHVAVVLDDDPGADLGAAGFHGHRFFFAAAEVEPL